MYGIVYLIIDGTNDLEYVGQTRCTLGKRFNQHTKNNSYIGNAIRVHGAENFVAAVLKKCASKEELDFWEKHFIKSRDTKYPNGYNLTDGGDGTIGLERTPEWCANISAGLTGKSLSLEHRKNISKSKKGKPLSAKHRANIGLGNRGKKHKPFSSETCARMSAAARGKKKPPRSQEHCANLSASTRKDSPFKNLAKEITEHKLSYASLSKLMGIHNDSLSCKMLGKRNFTSDDVSKLVEFFQLPAKYLMARDDGLEVTISKRGISPFKNLIKEMQAKQISYAGLAELFGLSQDNVTRKIRNIVNFTDKDKKKLAEIFDKPIEYLLERNE